MLSKNAFGRKQMIPRNKLRFDSNQVRPWKMADADADADAGGFDRNDVLRKLTSVLDPTNWMI